MNFMLIFTKQFPKLFVFFNGTVTEIQNWPTCVSVQLLVKNTEAVITCFLVRDLQVVSWTCTL